MLLQKYTMICLYTLRTKLKTSSKKTEDLITKKESQCQELALQIQEMQSAMQKAAVEAAKASVAQAGASG